MNRMLLIARRDFAENMRTKGFWVGILMLPVMLAMVALVPLAIDSMRVAKRYTVIDHSGWLLPVVRHEIRARDLTLLLERIRHNGDVSHLPLPFRHLQAILVKLNRAQTHALAFRILDTIKFAGNYDHATLPPDALEYIDRYGVQIARWWDHLSPAVKAGYSSRISTNQYVFVPPPSTKPAVLNRLVQQGDLAAYFVIGKHPIRSSNGCRYVSNNLTDHGLHDWFVGYVSRHIRKERLRQERMTPGKVDWINKPISFKDVQITGTGIEQPVKPQDVIRQWMPVVFVYLLWISILINTQMLLTNTIEEKSNRLIEMLLSSVSPLVLMSGKILGIAVTGLTMILCWILMATAFLVFVPPELHGLKLSLDIGGLLANPWLLGSFAVYFVLGYLFYAALLVGIGSTCSSLKEAQNLMLPIQLLQMVPIFVMIPVGRDPNGLLAHILSYIPPLTPFIMMNRAAGPPALIEYFITTLLLFASIALALWFAAKVFRIGILMTGKPPGFLEILRWLRAPVSKPV